MQKKVLNQILVSWIWREREATPFRAWLPAKVVSIRIVPFCLPLGRDPPFPLRRDGPLAGQENRRCPIGFIDLLDLSVLALTYYEHMLIINTMEEFKMARPMNCRRVGFMPQSDYFKPRGIPLSILDEVVLTVDELEAVRLADLEGLYQEQQRER